MADEIYSILIKLAEPVIEKLKKGQRLSAEDRDYLMMYSLSKEYREGTERLSKEYREGTERLSKEYREGTERIEGGIEKLSREYREGTERIIAKIENAEEHIDRGFEQLSERFLGLEKALANYAGEINGLIKGLHLKRE